MRDRDTIDQALADSGAVVLKDLDDALVGYGERFGEGVAAVYDVDQIVKIFMERDGMSYLGAVEFFEFNVAGGFFGDPRPVFLHRAEIVGS